MAREQFFKKWAVYGAFLLTVQILQSMVFSGFAMFGAHPMITPLAVASVSLFEGSLAGGGFGLAAGLLCDLAFHESTVMFAVFFTLLGVMIGWLSEKAITRGFPSYLLCGTLGLILTAAIQALPFIAFERLTIEDVLPTAVDQTVCSLLFILPVYYAARTIYIRTSPK